MTTRCFLAPEVIQASAMDCGPAALKCLLEGHRTPVSYGRLREACQTDVDGASIDTLEEVAVQLGLDAEQVMLPPDHLLLAASNAPPALVVMRMPGGDPHVVVLWRTHGPVVQLMDPATGRRWTTATRFLDDCYIHTTEVPAAVWREWAGSSAALAVLRRRLRRLRVSPSSADALAGHARDDPGWRALGALDAATRMTTSLVAARGIAKGQEAENILRRLFDDAVAGASSARLIPDEYWTVSAAPPVGEQEQVRLRGAVLVTVRGARPVHAGLSPELRAALEEHPTRPSRELLALLAADGVFAPLSMGLALALAGGGVLLEALLFRGIFDLGRELGLSGQRLGALALATVLLGLLLVLEFPLAAMVLRMGRHLECRLRLAFLRKIPRLGDRYFQSRLRSDMTERSHSIYRIRRLPDLGAQWLRFVFELVLTAVGIAWLDPGAAPIAALSAAVALLVPLAVQPLFSERDLRVRTHMGALGRYYLDALLGLRAIRCHGAERPIRREHEGLLVEWARAGFRLQRLAAGVEAVQLSLGLGLSVWLLFDHVSRNREVGSVLLLIYWALHLPMLGQEIGHLAWHTRAFAIPRCGCSSRWVRSNKSSPQPVFSRQFARLASPFRCKASASARRDTRSSTTSVLTFPRAHTSPSLVHLAPASRVSSAYCSGGTVRRRDASLSTANRSKPSAVSCAATSRGSIPQSICGIDPFSTTSVTARVTHQCRTSGPRSTQPTLSRCCRRCRTVCRHRSGRAGRAFRAARGSACVWPERCCGVTCGSPFSTSRFVDWSATSAAICSVAHAGCGKLPRSSASRTISVRPWRSTASSSSRAGTWWKTGRR